MVGVLHHKPPTIELPSALEPIRETATPLGESLELVLRRINEQQLVTGRIGLLLDLPDEATMTTVTPYIVTYAAEKVFNWDSGNAQSENVTLVVLDESDNIRGANNDWTFVERQRVLLLENGIYEVILAVEGSDAPSIETVTPSIRGNTLDTIPFVFVNSSDISTFPDKPPLLGLAAIAMVIYRGEADYRLTLFTQGQNTLVVIGSADGTSFRVGADSSITLPIGGDAKYIGVSGDGLPEMRSALENDRNRAAQAGGQMLDSVSRERESGEALKVRVAARTASLNQVAMAGAFGLEQILKIAARWIGANEDEVIVTPNLDFVDDTLGGKTLVEYMTAKSLGAPFSMESIHELMQDKGLTERRSRKS